jgi:hypothetical protein
LLSPIRGKCRGNARRWLVQGYLDRQTTMADRTRKRAATKALWDALTPEQRRVRVIIGTVIVGVIVIIAVVSAATSKNTGNGGGGTSASGGPASYSVTIQSQTSSDPNALQVIWTVTNTGGASGHPYCLVDANPSGYGDAVDPGQLDPGGSANETTNLSVSENDYTPGTTAVVTCN